MALFDRYPSMFDRNPAGLRAAADVIRANRAAEVQENAAKLAAAAREEAAARSSGDIRGMGTLTKYRPIGGWLDERGAGKGPSLRYLQEAAELGAPTSFNAGAGAPEPIGVIRGMRQTFAPQRQPDQQFIEGEYSTPLRSAQAYNRAAGVGGYEPVEAQVQDPFKAAQTQAITGARLSEALKARVLNKYGTTITDEIGQQKRVLHPEFERLLGGQFLNTEKDLEAAMRQIEAEAPTVQKIVQYNTPEARKRAETNYRLMAGPNARPEELERIRKAPITRENLRGFEDIYNYNQPGGQSSLRQMAEDTGLAAALDRATLLGKTMAYELQPSLRRVGVPAPTLENVGRERMAERRRIWEEEK